MFAVSERQRDTCRIDIATTIVVTVTSPYGYRVQYINLIHYNMKAKRISQRAVKNMINSNTVLLHIGKFKRMKRTNLRRAVDECVYASRLYYNTELQSDSEKIKYLSVYDAYRLFKVKLYETRIAALNEYTEYHINYDATSKYYTLVISGMQFLIVSDMGWCNIYQVFEAKGDDKEYKLTVEFRNGQICCYVGKTKKQAIAEFKRGFGSFRGFIKKEWELV